MQYSLIVQRLADYRKSCGILQNDMAEYLDITQSQYSKIELGKVRLSYEILQKLDRHGCDIDKMITGKSKEVILPRFKRIYEEKSAESFQGWLKLCSCALEQWYKNKEAEESIGSKLLRIYTRENDNMMPLERLRMVQKISQQELAEQIGVNIKKYRCLEKGRIGLDAELMANLYEITSCRPSYFIDENNFYLSVISEECRYNKKKENVLTKFLFVQEMLEEAARAEEVRGIQ